LGAKFPPDIEKAIRLAYADLCRRYGQDVVVVAVRGSATAEDLPTASFAGQQETFLNVTGPAMVLDACQKCYASLFTNRAISYRREKGFDHLKVALSIGVQKMVRSE
jgi:pyruvate,water dikinase